MKSEQVQSWVVVEGAELQSAALAVVVTIISNGEGAALRLQFTATRAHIAGKLSLRRYVRGL